MSINTVHLVGRLGRDPEMRTTASGMAIASLSVATDRWKKDEGKVTDWHRVKAFGRQAESISRYLSKGSEVAVVGRLETSSYDKDGERRYVTEVIADRVAFIGGRSDRAPQQPAPSGGYDDSDDIPF